ncbi:MAG TPA: hypothetical protein VGO63_02030 [Candidatus Paceibacterota bacterium]|jgi:hypothetical protein|nr:hypothetical protein [Candidatus Paceibacterota bacterium]
MKSLSRNLEEFSFVKREKVNGKTVTNRCGRDFLYYGLNYTFPDKFNASKLNPVSIENNGLFGLRLPSWLMWTQLQFFRLPKYLKKNNLKLFINNREINTFGNFFNAILFSRMKLADAMQKIEQAIDEDRVVGIDIGLKYAGLLDHIIFVYGYDVDALYLCDTHKVPILEYTKLSNDGRYYMKLTKEVIKKKWTKFGRVWELRRI